MSISSTLNQHQINESLKRLSGWDIHSEKIIKNYKFPDFTAAVGFVNRVAELAEARDHHPDILIQYNKVKLTLSTHSAGGLTNKDFELAQEIDGSPA